MLTGCKTWDKGTDTCGRRALVGRHLAVLLLFLVATGCQLIDSVFTTKSLQSSLKQSSSKPVSSLNSDTAGNERASPADPVEPSTDIPHPDAPALSLDLTLEQALHHALTTSKGIRVLSSVPQEVLSDVDIELAKFDPAVSSGAQFGQYSQQASSTIQALGNNLNSFQSTTLGPAGNLPNQLQLEKQWQSGTRARIGYNTMYNFNNPAGQFLIVNPAYRSGVRLTVEQPIFRGARSRINQMGIRIARIRHDQSNEEFKAEVSRILHEVEIAWWELYLSKSNVESLMRIVEYAEQTWKNEQRQHELGLNSVADESQARENLEATRAQLAGAEGELIASEQQLRQKLGLDPALTVRLVTQAVPLTSQFEPDLELGIQQALADRPEVKAQSRMVQMTAMELDRQKDGLLPDISLLAGYGFSGLSNNFYGSVNSLASANYPNWNLGLTFNQSLGQRAAKSSLRRTELAYSRAKLAQSARDDEVSYEVRESHDQIKSAYTVLERQNARLKAAESRFQTHRRMYETGQLDIDRLMPSQQAYVMALRDQHTALAQYNVSINRWHYVTGQLTVESVDQSALHANTNTDDQSSTGVPQSPTATDGEHHSGTGSHQL